MEIGQRTQHNHQDNTKTENKKVTVRNIHNVEPGGWAKRPSLHKEKERNSKMKKMILTMMMMLSVSATFAEDANVMGNQEPNIENANFDMNCDLRRLAVTLGMTTEQLEDVQLIHKQFVSDMQEASKASNSDARRAIMNNAIDKDLRWMRYVLSDKQYRKYLTLLNVTLVNKGLR